MLQSKEHWSPQSLHDPLLEMTNGLSCLLNFLRGPLCRALGPSEVPVPSIMRHSSGALKKGGL